MQDILDILSNIKNITENPNSFQVLKDFERVLDEMDLYVYKNWENGELAMGPKIERYWVTCGFMWDEDKMPDPSGGKRLLDYDCKVKYIKTFMLEPRIIKSPDDFRPGTKKGKLDKRAVWIVEITMPKKLIQDIYNGYTDVVDYEQEAAESTSNTQELDLEAEVPPADSPDSAAPAVDNQPEVTI
jgi:hypothetical protein